jgi:hypothetical protein
MSLQLGPCLTASVSICRLKLQLMHRTLKISNVSQPGFVTSKCEARGTRMETTAEYIGQQSRDYSKTPTFIVTR